MWEKSDKSGNWIHWHEYFLLGKNWNKENDVLQTRFEEIQERMWGWGEKIKRPVLKKKKIKETKKGEGFKKRVVSNINCCRV